MKPRLLYVTTLSEMGGAQNHILELVRNFRDKYDVAVAVGEEGYMTEKLAEMGIAVHIVPTIVRSVNPISDIRAILALRKLMRRWSPQITHSHSTKAGLIVRIAARLARVRSVHSIHGWAFDSGVPFSRKLIVWPVEAVAALFSDRLVTPTDYDKAYGTRRLPVAKHRFSIIPYGIAPDAPIATPERDVGPVKIIMPARFSEQKDQETLIQAVGQIADLDFELNLVGDGPSRGDCERMANAIGIGSKINFLGTRRDLNDLLAQSQVFCLCTHYEGLPLSIMEAMRAGLPVVATDVSGVKEEIDDGVTGFLVPHKGIDETAVSLRKLISGPAMRQAFGAAGRNKFQSEFVDTVMVARMDALYSKIMAGEI